jgi:glycosyltransferase involved in cell wall biosynthesis
MVLPPLKILLLNQAFYPDVASTAQHLTDLALALAARGHHVTVVTSRRAYDDPQTQFARREIWRGIQIERVGGTFFGKGAKWRRAADFASFLLACCLRLVTLPRQDAVVALTTPPLISFIGAWLARWRGSRFFYWVMDFNPDEAIAAGWLRADSLLGRLLERMSRFSLRRAHRIIALDRFMRDRILAKGIAAEKIVVLPPWSHDDHVHYDPAGRAVFRKQHGLDGKFVVTYSGNHSPVHPLATLLAAAERLAADPGIVFCFIGGGSEWRKIQQLVSGPPTARNRNLVCLPYQPLNQLSASLSAADLHVVVMGNAFVGLVHPCKIYNILSVAAPVLYIGPQPSHLTEILATAGPQSSHRQVAHGDVDQLVHQIQQLRQRAGVVVRQVPNPALAPFTQAALLPQLVAVIEAKAAAAPATA